MIKKRASEIFARVDPKLRVIDGGTHHRRYRPHWATNEDWDNARGLVCSSCGREAMRVTDGLCPECRRKVEAEREEKLGRKREKRYLVNLFNKGKITLAQLREGRY